MRRLVPIVCVLGISLSFCAGDQKKNGTTIPDDPEEFKARLKQKSEQYLARSEEETREFMATLAGKTKEEKLDTLRSFKTDMYRKNCEHREQMHQERRQFVQKRLDSNPNVPPARKQRMLAFIDRQYEDLNAFHVKKHEENMAFIDSLRRDESIDGRPMMEKLQAFFKKQKEDARAFMEQQRAEMQPGER